MRVIIWTASGRRYGIETRHALEVVPVVDARPMDGVDAWVRGLMNYRGRLVPLLDAPSLLGVDAWTPRRGSRIIMLQLDPDAVAGLLVEHVAGVETVDFADPGAHPGLDTHAYLGPVVLAGDVTVQLVEPAKLLSAEQTQIILGRRRGPCVMSVHAVRDWLVRHTDLAPELLDGASFERIVEDRQRALGLGDERAYLEYLGGAPEEVIRIVGEVAVPESWLFRYPASFELLSADLAERLSDGSTDATRTLRMLSIASALGQEPCSMAIAALRAGWPPDRVRIDAVELDPQRVAVARRGRFGGHDLRSGIPEWARRWLTADGGDNVAAPEVLSMIEFHHGDVLRMSLDLPGGYDVVFCRNLLIYLSETARVRLVDQLADWLVPDGLLFVGHAELHGVVGRRFAAAPAPGAFALRPGEPVSASRPVRPPDRPRAGAVARRPGRAAPLIETVRPARERPLSAPPVSRPAPRTAAVTLADARALADRGRLDEALHAAETLIHTEGVHVDALELLGSVQLAQGRLDAARDSFRKVVYLEPGHEAALLQMALISERLRDHEQADRYRRRAERAHQRQVDGDRESRDA